MCQNILFYALGNTLLLFKMTYVEGYKNVFKAPQRRLLMYSSHLESQSHVSETLPETWIFMFSVAIVMSPAISRYSTRNIT